MDWAMLDILWILYDGGRPLTMLVLLLMLCYFSFIPSPTIHLSLMS